MKILVIAALLLAPAASADTVWNYQGNSTSDPAVGHLDFEQQAFVPTPNPCSCAISGSLTLSDAGVPVLWDFSAGAVTLTNLNSSISLDDTTAFFLHTPSPPFLFWSMAIIGQSAGIFSSFTGSDFDATDGVTVNGATYQYVQGNHGVWTDPPIGTPEPGTLLLLGIAISALALKRLA